MSGKRYFFWGIPVLGMMILLCGCQKNIQSETPAAPPDQIAIPTYEGRNFDTGDKGKTLRAAIVALQELDFVIDKADEARDLISGNKTEGGITRITVVVRQKSPEQVVVRAVITQLGKVLENPEYYQSFFDALSRTLSLIAHTDEETSAAASGPTPMPVPAPAPAAARP